MLEAINLSRKWDFCLLIQTILRYIPLGAHACIFNFFQEYIFIYHILGTRINWSIFFLDSNSLISLSYSVVITSFASNDISLYIYLDKWSYSNFTYMQFYLHVHLSFYISSTFYLLHIHDLLFISAIAFKFVFLAIHSGKNNRHSLGILQVWMTIIL